MHFSLIVNRERSSGFTLIEMLIIAPVVILVIGSFVALIVSMIGDVLLSRDKNLVTYDIQDSLTRIEQDVHLNTKFLTTTGTQPTPQGSDNNFAGTAAFTNGTNTLILNGLATDQNPVNSGRGLIYYANQPNPCGAQQSFNRVFSIRIVYFINNGSLWRRTLVPDYDHNGTVDSQTVCTSSPWQQNSCNPGNLDARCQTYDAQIMQNVSSLSIQYFSNPNSTIDIGPSNANSATTINATITGQKTVAGRPLSSTASLRATKLNIISTN